MKNFDKSIWSEACTGMITDECDRLKIDYTCLTGYMSNKINPMFFGRLRTVELEEGDYLDENINLGLGFLDRLSFEDVLFVKGSSKFAYFGELMTRFSNKKNISGVIIDGATRDNNYTKNNSLGILYKSKTPVDIKGRGRVKLVDNDVTIQNVKISTKSFVFADSDGVVIINNKDLKTVESAVKYVIEKEKNIIKSIQDNVSIFDIINKFESF